MLTLEKCTLEDIGQLAVFNKLLIEDEQSDNQMGVAELEERMRGFLMGEYDAYFFVEAEHVVGYALVKNSSNPLYLRQFYVERECRKQHYGTKAFELLLEYLEVDSIDIEVLSWNERGISFWESCGFKERSRYMRFEKENHVC